MANQFGIPIDIEKRIRSRDKVCVYCRKSMTKPSGGGFRGKWATIEHFNFDGPFYWKEDLKESDLAICCGSCNSSRGIKKLPEWFESNYCVRNNINKHSVAGPVKKFINSHYK